ncbi:integrase [Kitasatospora sp. NPDC028055]|uniref:integrase n=1 Tax=Kitasatospora sp. NPDC028055 TaxID=3155653 RepID=UPI0033D873A9
MTTAAIELDPYILSMPTADSAVVLPKWISPTNDHPNGRYRDLVWPLAPLIDNPASSLVSIHWKNCPEEMRDQLKQVAWAMINGELRPSHLKQRGAAARGRASASELSTTCREWMRLARWLVKRGTTDLADCSPDDFAAYAAYRKAEGISREDGKKLLGRLTDLWAFDQLTASPLGVVQPSWMVDGVDDHLPAETGEGGRENSTEPLDPQVIGPLLVWASRMVEDFADDILAAWAERCRMNDIAVPLRGNPEGQAALEAYLLPLIQSGAPLPTSGTPRAHSLARTFIAATTGASLSQVSHFGRRHGLSRLAAERAEPARLPTAITGLIEGRPWREFISFDEAGVLIRHLGTAAAVVCLYLTGMRPQEVQGLRSGCCPTPEPRPDGTTGHHLIYSRHYKSVTDADGNHISAGEDREVPWTAITPVVRAIRVLERMVPDGELLLSAAHHDIMQRRLRGALKRGALRQRIEEFVAWVNQEAQIQGLAEQVIPEDPHGKIGLARFRRTLAWHVARRPGGLIALAIQYGHMRTILDARTSTGYGARSRRGIHGELDVETVMAAADTAAKLNDRMAAGEKISGPAARRALTAAATTPRFEGKLVTPKFAKKAASFLARDGLVLFDNPDAHLICVFKRDTALCDPSPDAIAPNQFACELGCGNAVRTDTHAAGLRERAGELEALAAAAPEPVGRRLKRNADRLREVADTHDATAQRSEALT